MHLDFNVSLAQIVNFVFLLGVIIRVEGWGRKFMVEHEILVKDYCIRKGIKTSDLPTRSH